MTDSFPPELEKNIPLKPADFLRPDRVALIMWDMQKGLTGRAPNVATIVKNAQALLAAADGAGIPVIWSRHILPPLRLTNGPFLQFLMKKQKVDRPSLLKPTMQEGMEDTQFVDGLAPRPGDIVLQKNQPSLFFETALDNRLKTLGRDTIVIAGVATDIGVELNCRHAALLGYYSVAVEDATGSYDPKVHERSLDFLRGWTSPVLPTATICKAWGKA